MSHFFTVVLVPKGTDDVRAKVAELLAPYDENLEVPEYDSPCSCVGSQARREEAWEQAQAETQTVEAYRKAFQLKNKWDWWSVGGRWDGDVRGEPRRSEDGYNFDNHRLLEHNETAVAEMAREVIPYAVVTPDGEWHERGQMGWFGMSSGEIPADEWKAKVHTLYAQHSGCIAIGCDLHI